MPETIQRAFERERELSPELRLANNQLTSNLSQEDKNYDENPKGSAGAKAKRRYPWEV